MLSTNWSLIRIAKIVLFISTYLRTFQTEKLGFYLLHMLLFWRACFFFRLFFDKSLTLTIFVLLFFILCQIATCGSCIGQLEDLNPSQGLKVEKVEWKEWRDLFYLLKCLGIFNCRYVFSISIICTIFGYIAIHYNTVCIHRTSFWLRILRHGILWYSRLWISHLWRSSYTLSFYALSYLFLLFLSLHY